ncbi:MAG: DUF58 domain-containing protein [Sphingobacteriales bacterium]|nr:MAG: DUF58 domain-containing protein [Sphingobacteriales bacterium]
MVALAALGLGLLSTLLAWVWQHRTASKGTTTLSLQPTTDQQQPFEVRYSGTAIPFWGNRQVQLLFENGEATPLVPMQVQRLFSVSDRRQTATGILHLQHVQVYQLRAVRYWFKDVFGLLALHTDVPATAVAFRNPEEMSGMNLVRPPRQAVEMTRRTDVLQRIEGDLYNSRLFSTGDDMRRILWPVYARTGELMVRIPEIFEPYASVLTVFAAFGARLPVGFSAEGAASGQALDFYKNAVWTLYQNLRQNGSDVRLKLAQSQPYPEDSDPAAILRYQLSASHWQPEEESPESKTGLLLVSSLVPEPWLQNWLDRFSGMQQVVLVQLSAAFDEPRRRSVLSRLLFRLPQGKAQREARLSTRLFKQQLQAREASLLSMLQRHDALAGTFPVSEGL